MKIGILVAGLPPEQVGGSELQAMQVALRLSARHDVTVFTRTASVPPELAASPRCRVVRRAVPAVPGLRFAVDVTVTLAHLFANRRRVDVILAYQSVIDGLIGVLAKWALGVPVVVSIRGEAEYRMSRSRQSRWLGTFVFRHADRLLVQSPAIARELLSEITARTGERDGRKVKAKLAVIPNGVELVARRLDRQNPNQLSQVFSPGEAGQADTATSEVEPTWLGGLRLRLTSSPADPCTVMFLGRLTEGKGVHVLIDAMRECPHESLVIVGDGPERARLEAHARGLKQVTFAGAASRAEVEHHFSRAKMLVLPSFHEGQPNVLIEAMARGVPVVATAVGGIPDLVRQGETGLLIAPGDVGGVADAIRRIAEAPELGRALATQARREVERYGWETVLAQLESELVAVALARGRLA